MSTYTLSNFRSIPASSLQDFTKLVFDEKDVLTLDEDIRVRFTNFDKAIALGNSKTYKTAIIVKTTTGLSKIETEIVSHDAENVYTSNKLKIPVKCIYSVDFY